MSRQRLWQLKQKARGLCMLCAQPICPASRRYCSHHRVDHATRKRNAYRLSHDIPLEAPLYSVGIGHLNISKTIHP
jgi:hypothetical protein